MKDILMFMTSWCPYCKKASQLIDQLRSENLAYRDIEIIRIDEDKERKYADTFDYYRVPTFYVDGVKVHEGAADLESIRKVFERAIQ
jgi:glutaredoxin